MTTPKVDHVMLLTCWQILLAAWQVNQATNTLAKMDPGTQVGGVLLLGHPVPVQSQQADSCIAAELLEAAEDGGAANPLY